MHALQWLAERDRGLSALRRAGRTAIVMPSMFALGDRVIGNPTLATFAAFGSFAMLLLVDFNGPMRDRLQAQASLAVLGAVFVCLGTLASRNPWLAGSTMAVIGFGVLFAGVVSSVLAAASTSALLAFILPVSLPGLVSSIPSRLAGWGLASVVAFAAVALLWPAPARDALRGPASAACRAIAARLRSDVEFMLGGRRGSDRQDHVDTVNASSNAVAALHRTFLSTPFRPTGLSTSNRKVVRLVDELNWLDAILRQSPVRPDGPRPPQAVCTVKLAAADALEAGADLLDRKNDPVQLHRALAALSAGVQEMERHATVDLPQLRSRPKGAGIESDALTGRSGAQDQPVEEFLSSLDPSFRAQELAFTVSAVANNIDLAAAADRRSWLDRLLGRTPQGLAGPISAAHDRAFAHFERHSVWLHNSVRGAIGLGSAVLVADLTGVQHSFWVVLATLSVLRSNALSTGQNALRGFAGTVAGFVVGAAVLALIGTTPLALWVVLPVAILFAGLAPAVISFTAGQAAFTLVIVILFNIIQPAGWRVGLLRVEDIALGCSVSLVVGALFWPRGAGAALGRALAEAYRDSARYLADAVLFGMLRCDTGAPRAEAPTEIASLAAASSRRLDDTFRNYLAESGSKPIPLAEVTALVTGTAALRLSADAVLDLWLQDDGRAVGDRAAARRELLRTSSHVSAWFSDLADSLIDGRPVRDPLPHDNAADGRLVDAVRHDLRGDDGNASATAVRMIWTGDHLDAARRLQAAVTEPARTALELRRKDRLGHLFSGHLRRRPTVPAVG